MMKKLRFLALFLSLFTITFYWSSCSKTEDEENTTWNEEEQAAYKEVLNLQDEVSNKLDEWFSSLDSTEAINLAYQYFNNDPIVSTATINRQGISVQYANGMRGGIFLDPGDSDTDKNSQPLFNDLPEYNSPHLKSIVNKRKMLLINPHYWERSYYTDFIYSYGHTNLQSASIDLATFYKDDEATVDRFTELSGYGIIQIYSHGIAWPKQENITEVYLLTGETVNVTTSEKYWEDLKNGNIPIMKTFFHPILRSNEYLISKDFITKYNDFSQDTVLFYGGFCYSFLGSWPDITESFADGTYLGFDWSINTFHNANWSINMLALMSDTSKSSPMNIQSWMDDPTMEKSYWSTSQNRTVSLHYTGDGNLRLWDDAISVRLIALSSDGTPVSNPGEVDVQYPFKCEVTTTVSDLEYLWDMGNGSSPVSASNAVYIKWNEEGNYELVVQVKDKSNGNIIGMASADVVISNANDDEILDILLSCNLAGFRIGPEDAVQLSPPTNIGGDYIRDNMNIHWSGLGFSGEYLYQLGGKSTLVGNISEDAQTISFVFDQELVSEYTGNIFKKYTITISNLPISYYYENPSSASYSVDPPNIHNYVTAFEGYYVDENITHSITGFDWSLVDKLNLDFSIQ